MKFLLSLQHSKLILAFCSYHKADIDLFCDTLQHLPWNCVSSSDIEEAWLLWKDMFLGAADASIPKVRWRRSKMKHWFSYETIHLIRLKRRLYNRMIKSPTSAVITSRYKCISKHVARKFCWGVLLKNMWTFCYCSQAKFPSLYGVCILHSPHS